AERPSVGVTPPAPQGDVGPQLEIGRRPAEPLRYGLDELWSRRLDLHEDPDRRFVDGHQCLLEPVLLTVLLRPERRDISERAEQRRERGRVGSAGLDFFAGLYGAGLRRALPGERRLRAVVPQAQGL